MNPADIVAGLLLSLGSAAYLAHGWLRARRTDDGVALAHDLAAEQASRRRHPSGRAA